MFHSYMAVMEDFDFSSGYHGNDNNYDEIILSK